MNEKMNKNSPVENKIKENLSITCPENITTSVMNEIRVNYFQSVKIKPRFILPMILICCVLMIGLLYLFTLVQVPDIGDDGIVKFSFNYFEISKFMIGMWKLNYFSIFIISFSLIVFIDIFLIKRKEPI